MNHNWVPIISLTDHRMSFRSRCFSPTPPVYQCLYCGTIIHIDLVERVLATAFIGEPINEITIRLIRFKAERMMMGENPNEIAYQVGYRRDCREQLILNIMRQ